MSKNLRFKSTRAGKDMSQKEVAEAVGVTRQTINAIENGGYNPSFQLCRDICKVLGKTLDQIFGEDDNNE
ncbi:helix-turn-helix transcriptional regulator [Clostridium estertheticum]|uniref:helix-turn-helix transcriptional regulator n=1 Tax=Clostridium estertheticum TaxID=238834 RepID=UPI001C0D9D15|nr:helix-turn-helix transcriptional regulator [Clostridium estertheticum]MBU3187197.1 helix-turn-helix transcriptional regulator [Clostridium estertheticum]